MARFLVLLNIGMFVGYNAFGYIADRVGKKKALILSLVCSGLLLPFYVQATDHLLLLWLGPVFAFFMAFAGLMGSYFAELFPSSCAPRARASASTWDAASPPSRRCCWARCPPPSASARASPPAAACS